MSFSLPSKRPRGGGMPWPAIVLGGIGWTLKGSGPCRKEIDLSKIRNQDLQDV